MTATKIEHFATHAALMEMWQSDLAKYIRRVFYAEPSHFAEYNLKLAGEVWKERFGQYPIIGEIELLAK